MNWLIGCAVIFILWTAYENWIARTPANRLLHPRSWMPQLCACCVLWLILAAICRGFASIPEYTDTDISETTDIVAVSDNVSLHGGVSVSLSLAGSDAQASISAVPIYSYYQREGDGALVMHITPSVKDVRPRIYEDADSPTVTYRHRVVYSQRREYVPAMRAWTMPFYWRGGGKKKVECSELAAIEFHVPPGTIGSINSLDGG